MDFSSKLTLMLVLSQDWLILHKDKGKSRVGAEFRGVWLEEKVVLTVWKEKLMD